MAQCPSCGQRGAYIGFIKIECRNIECEMYVADLPPYCGNCDQEGHSTYDCPRQATLSKAYDDSGGNWQDPTCYTSSSGSTTSYSFSGNNATPSTPTTGTYSTGGLFMPPGWSNVPPTIDSPDGPQPPPDTPPDYS